MTYTKEDLPKFTNLMNICKELEVTPFDLFAYSLMLEVGETVKELVEDDPDSTYTIQQALEMMCEQEDDLVKDLYQEAIELNKFIDPIHVPTREPDEGTIKDWSIFGLKNILGSPTEWLSTTPSHCEVCQRPITDKFYDAATGSLHGPWACMCQNCFIHGPGINQLGLGAGQQYELKDGKWLCVAGGETGI